MALSDRDKQEIQEMIVEAVFAARVRQDGPGAVTIIDLLQQPHVKFYPGPARSRYTQATLLDSGGVPRHQLRVRTADLRNLLLDAYNTEPGAVVENGREPEPITGPVPR